MPPSSPYKNITRIKKNTCFLIYPPTSLINVLSIFCAKKPFKKIEFI